MTERVVLPVKRMLVVDDDRTFRTAALAWGRKRVRSVAVESTFDAALRRCASESFDLVISDIFLGTEPSGIDLVLQLHAENLLRRRLALVSAALDVRAALIVARNLPADIILQTKGRDILTSVLHEAETGKLPTDAWPGEVPSFDRVRREYLRCILARVGNNRSELARRLGVDRSTVFRHLEQMTPLDG